MSSLKMHSVQLEHRHFNLQLFLIEVRHDLKDSVSIKESILQQQCLVSTRHFDRHEVCMRPETVVTVHLSA